MLSPLSKFQRIVIGNTLRKCSLFADVSIDTLENTVAISVGKSFAKGDYLFHEGTPIHGFYVVQQGAIKLHRVNASGREQVVHVFRPYEMIGDEALLSESGYPADACATEPSRVVMVPKAEFLSLLKRQPELVVSLLRSLGHEFRLLLDLLDDLTLKDVATRLANWLIQHCPNPESTDPYTIELPMAKRLLASELGTVSETFSRTLAKFRDKKLLTIDGKAVTLLCPNKLVHLARMGFGLEPFGAKTSSWENALYHRHPSNFVSEPRNTLQAAMGKANRVTSPWTAPADLSS